MLSFKHHALYWVLSLLTVPLAELREYLVYHGLLADFINQVHFPVLCLTVYVSMRYSMGIQEEKLQEGKEGAVTTFRGNVTAANLDEPWEEEQDVKPECTKANGNANGHLNGNANGNGNGQAAKRGKKKKRFARGPNGKPRQVQRSRNGNARQSNRNGTPQNPLVMPPGVDPRQVMKASAAKKKPTSRTVAMVCNFYLVLYFMSLTLLCTQKDWTLGFSANVEEPYILWSARILLTF
ncbi:hypothetical protein ACHAPU_008088, partial [Fusarium lateritium]